MSHVVSSLPASLLPHLPIHSLPSRSASLSASAAGHRSLDDLDYRSVSHSASSSFPSYDYSLPIASYSMSSSTIGSTSTNSNSANSTNTTTSNTAISASLLNNSPNNSSTAAIAHMDAINALTLDPLHADMGELPSWAEYIQLAAASGYDPSTGTMADAMAATPSDSFMGGQAGHGTVSGAPSPAQSLSSMSSTSKPVPAMDVLGSLQMRSLSMCASTSMSAMAMAPPSAAAHLMSASASSAGMALSAAASLTPSHTPSPMMAAGSHSAVASDHHQQQTAATPTHASASAPAPALAPAPTPATPARDVKLAAHDRRNTLPLLAPKPLAPLAAAPSATASASASFRALLTPSTVTSDLNATAAVAHASTPPPLQSGNSAGAVSVGATSSAPAPAATAESAAANATANATANAAALDHIRRTSFPLLFDMSQLSLVSATDPNSPFSSSLMSSLPQPLSFGPGTLSLMDMPNGPSSSGIPTPSHHMPVSTPVTASPASAVSASAHDPFNYANSYFASTLPPLGSFSTGTEAGAHSIGAFNHRSIPGLMTMGPNGKRRYSSLPGLNTLKAPTMSPFPYPHATHYEHFEPLLEHHSQQSHQQQQMQQQHQAQAQAHMQMQMQQGAPMGGQLSSSATHGDGKVGKTRPRSKSHNSHSSRPNALIDALNIPAPLVELTSPFDHDYSPMPASAPDHSQSADRFVSDDAAAMAGHGFAKKPMPVFSSAGDNVFLMTPPAMHDMPHFGLLPHSVIPHPQSHHMMYTPHSLQLSQTHSNQQVSIQQLQQIQVQQMNHNQQQQQQQQHMVQAHHMQLPPHLQQASSEQLMAADHHMAMAQSMEKEQQMHMQIQMQQHQQAQAQSAQQAAEPKPKTSPKPRQRRKSSVSKPMLSSIAPASSAGVMAGNPFPPMQVPSLTDTELSSSSLSAAVEIPPCPAGETSWKCSCGQVFEDWPLFYVHNNTHKAEEKTHICEHCNRGFTRRQDLKRHKLTHFQLFKPFECKNCGTTFTRNDALHRHIKARRCG